MKLMRRIIHCLLIPAICIPMLTGCWDRLDPENMAFIMAIGVDTGPKNDYIYTFAVAMPKASSGATASSVSGSDQSSNKVVTIFSEEGANLSAALLTSQSFVARRLTLIHSKALVLGEELARQGILPVVGEVVRNTEFRRNVNILTTKGRAQEYMHYIKPKMENDINLWFELELDPHNIGAITPKQARFHDFILDMEQPGNGATSILTAVRPDIDKGSENLHDGESANNSNTSQPLVSEHKAGDLPRAGEVPIDFFGTAVYKGQKLRGFLNGMETKTLNMLRGQFEKTVWEFRDPSDPKLDISINMGTLTNKVMHAQRFDDHIQITFNITMEGDLLSSVSDVDYTQSENTKKLETSIEEQLKERASKLLNKMLYKWEVDCFHIGNQIRGSFPTLQDWYAYKWRDHIHTAKYDLNIQFKMRTFGDQVGPVIEGDQMTE
ncbi:Ger(x)C family spore germination protein [Paenibacillus glucanolyticus]|uniref:Ger(x)C family spore germination protein n=1 Tax=Paenibacillus glucanolyticus TaxID=59843 RepID=UPI0030C9880A